jgi:hypothetical protein
VPGAGLVALGELHRVAYIIYCCGQPICPMPIGHLAQLPDGILQALTEASKLSEKHTLPVSQFEYVRTFPISTEPTPYERLTSKPPSPCTPTPSKAKYL